MAEKGEVFYLVAEELAESQVVEGADETLPEAVFLVVPDRPDRQGTEILQLSRQGGGGSRGCFAHFEPSSCPVHRNVSASREAG